LVIGMARSSLSGNKKGRSTTTKLVKKWQYAVGKLVERFNSKMAIPPHLYSFAKNKSITIFEAKNTEHFRNRFHLHTFKDTLNILELQDNHDS